jgi:hypothetical protein
MVSWTDFTVQFVQTVIFTPEPSGFTTGKAVATILARFRDRFDGEMQVLPLPPEIPAELPRIVLQSADGRWRLNMGPSRIDCFWNNKSTTPPPSLPTLVRDCAEIPEYYAQESSARVGRVAMVVQRLFPVDNPAQMLIEQFCSESSQREPFNRPETFEIHNHKVYTPQQGIAYRVNSWVRCKSVTLAGDNRPAISVEQDINTLAENVEPRRFVSPGMLAFFDTAAHEADDILHKYFPNQDLS